MGVVKGVGSFPGGGMGVVKGVGSFPGGGMGVVKGVDRVQRGFWEDMT